MAGVEPAPNHKQQARRWVDHARPKAVPIDQSQRLMPWGSTDELHHLTASG